MYLIFQSPAKNKSSILLKHATQLDLSLASSTRLKSSKHAKMSANNNKVYVHFLLKSAL